MRWLVSMPVWGQEYVDRFTQAAWPSIKEALKLTCHQVSFHLYAEKEDIPGLSKVFTGPWDVTFHEVLPGVEKYTKFGGAHRDTISRAGDGDYVALLAADMILSREVFAACDRRLEHHSAVVAAATRTMAVRYPAPGQSSRNLLRWTMLHAHPSVRACFYGAQGNCPWATYFVSDNNVVLRGFHLHPVAIKKDRPISFRGSLDQDLLECFEQHEIHVVTDADEMALAELSPSSMQFYCPLFEINVENIARWGMAYATDVHWWLSTHRIVIMGDGTGCNDEEVWEQVLARPERVMAKRKFFEEGAVMRGSYLAS